MIWYRCSKACRVGWRVAISRGIRLEIGDFGPHVLGRSREAGFQFVVPAKAETERVRISCRCIIPFLSARRNLRPPPSITGGVLVSTGVAKQRGACRGACPRKTRALANLTANDDSYALAA